MALTDKLSAIGDAIRAKTGGTELLTLEQMPTEIASITTGGGGLPEEALIITGDCGYRFAQNGWNWFLEEYSNQITTKDITRGAHMFDGSSNLETIPFDINFFDYSGFSPSTSHTNNLTYGFTHCSSLTELPKLLNVTVSSLDNLFNGCKKIKEIPEDYFDTWKWDFIQSLTAPYGGGDYSGMFTDCHSLRKIPDNLFIQEHIPTYSSYKVYSNGFRNCYCLEELKLPVYNNASMTYNGFSNTVGYCGNLRSLTFNLQEDGTPFVCSGWKSQTLDLSSYIGYQYTSSAIYINREQYGFDDALRVTNDETYQALKDNSDYWTTLSPYSRFNHDSAVELINTLPDVSASGGTNTVKFLASCGESTDAGGCGDLTEEEIAVATAKGWTITLA